MNLYTPAALLQALISSDLLAFIQAAFKVCFGKDMDKNWHHEAIAYVLNQLLGGNIKCLNINLPPRSLKSFIVSIACPAFALGKDPFLKIMCVSYSDELATQHSKVFNKLVSSDFYRKRFKPGKTEITKTEYTTSVGGGRYAASVNGSLTGMGADIIIIDDPSNANDIHSPVLREKAKEWMLSTISTRLNDLSTGRIVMVAQRLHVEDVPGLVIRDNDWVSLVLPAIAPDDREVALSATTTHSWTKGEPLDAKRLSLAVLERQKKRMSAYYFAAQYLQAPVLRGGNMLNVDWLRYVGYPPTPRSDDLILQSWDTAMKTGINNDYSVCLTFRVHENHLYLIDVFRGQLPYHKLVPEVLTQAQRHTSTAILIEDKGSGTALIQTVKAQGLLAVIPVTPLKNKIEIIDVHTPKPEGGVLILPKSASWLDDFVEEYRAFPNGSNDDQIDALSQALDWLANRQKKSVFEVDWGWG